MHLSKVRLLLILTSRKLLSHIIACLLACISFTTEASLDETHTALHTVREDFISSVQAHKTPDYLYNTTPYELVKGLKSSWQECGGLFGRQDDHFTGLDLSGTVQINGRNISHSGLPIIPRMVFPHLMISPTQKSVIKKLPLERPDLFSPTATQDTYLGILDYMPAYLTLLNDLLFVQYKLQEVQPDLQASGRDVSIVQNTLNKIYSYYRGYIEYIVQYKVYGLTEDDFADLLEQGPVFLILPSGILDERSSFCIPRKEASQLVPELSAKAAQVPSTDNARRGCVFEQLDGHSSGFYIKQACSSHRDFMPAHELATYALNKLLFPDVPMPAATIGTISVWQDTETMLPGTHYRDIDTLMMGRTETISVFKEEYVPFEGYLFRRFSRRSYSLQISRFVKGKRLCDCSLEDIQSISQDDFTRLLIGAMLSFPVDYHSANFIVTDADPTTGKRRLFAIDNDDCFAFDLWNKRQRCTELKNFLWLLPQMKEQLSLDIVSTLKAYLDKYKPEQIIMQWLFILDQYSSHFEQYQKQLIPLQFEEGKPNDIPLKTSETMLVRICHILTCLKRVLNDYPQITGTQLLQKMYCHYPDKVFTSWLSVFGNLYALFQWDVNNPQLTSQNFHAILDDRLNYILYREIRPGRNLFLTQEQQLRLREIEASITTLNLLSEDAEKLDVSELLAKVIDQSKLSLTQSVQLEDLPLWSYIINLQAKKKTLLPISETFDKTFNADTMLRFYTRIVSDIQSTHPIQKHFGKEALQAWKKLESVDPILKWIRAREVFFPPSDGTTKPVRCSGVFSGNRVLASVTKDQLFTTEETGSLTLRSEGRLSGGRHPVYLMIAQDIDGDQISLIVKAFPEFPTLEMVVYELAKQFGVQYLFPYMELFVVRVQNGQKETLVPMMVQIDLGKTTLAEFMWDSSEKLGELNTNHLHDLMLVTMLLNPEDGKPNNYIVASNAVYAIDNERAFTHSVAMQHADKEIILPKSTLFCFDQVKECLSEEIKKKWGRIVVGDLLQSWTEFMISLQRKVLLMSGDLAFVESGAIDPLTPPNTYKTYMIIPFYPDSIKGLYTRSLTCVQTILDSSDATKMIDILEHVNPYMWQRYHSTLHIETVNERAQAADAAYYVRDVFGNFSTTTSTRHLFANASETLESYSQRGDYMGPNKALEVVILCKADESKDLERYIKDIPSIIVCKRLQKGWALSADHQKIVLRGLNDRSTNHHDPITILFIVRFTVFPTKDLHPNLLRSLRTLYLEGVSGIKIEDWKITLAAAVNLEKLICNDTDLKEVSDFTWGLFSDDRKALRLVNLRYLEVKGNKILTRVWLDAPELSSVIITNNPELRRCEIVQSAESKLKVINLSDNPLLTIDDLAFSFDGLITLQLTNVNKIPRREVLEQTCRKLFYHVIVLNSETIPGENNDGEITIYKEFRASLRTWYNSRMPPHLELKRSCNLGIAKIVSWTCIRHITSLDLHNNHIGDQGIIALANSRYLSNLIQLELYCNAIGNRGAQAISRLAQLTYLDVSWNNIGDDGAIALGRLTQLTYLDISWNSIDNTTAVNLAALLPNLIFKTVNQEPETYDISRVGDVLKQAKQCDIVKQLMPLPVVRRELVTLMLEDIRLQDTAQPGIAPLQILYAHIELKKKQDHWKKLLMVSEDENEQ